MTEWQEQHGGLHLAVASFDRNNHEHRKAAVSVIKESIQTVAQVHKADFDEIGFRNNMNALYSGDIEIDFYLAKWDICQPKTNPNIVGAVINWKTAGFDEAGNLRQGIYDEDICIFKSQLRNLVREKPNGRGFPKRSLAECFDQIRLEDLSRNKDMWFRFGEVDPDNTTMMRALNGSGATIGTLEDSGVLEFKRFPHNLSDNFCTDVEIINLGQVSTPNVFATRIDDGICDIRFVVTKGRATAIGRPRIDLRPWHNGSLPDNPAILNIAIASSLKAIKKKIDEEWNIESESSFANPLRPEEFRVLNNEPETHIFVMKDKRMLDAFIALDAERRFFGGKLMMPGVNYIGVLSSLAV